MDRLFNLVSFSLAEAEAGKKSISEQPESLTVLVDEASLLVDCRSGVLDPPPVPRYRHHATLASCNKWDLPDQCPVEHSAELFERSLKQRHFLWRGLLLGECAVHISDTRCWMWLLGLEQFVSLSPTMRAYVSREKWRLSVPSSSGGIDARHALFQSELVQDEFRKWWLLLLHCTTECRLREEREHRRDSRPMISPVTTVAVCFHVMNALLGEFVPSPYLSILAHREVLKHGKEVSLDHNVSYDTVALLLFQLVDFWTETTFIEEFVLLMSRIRETIFPNQGRDGQLDMSVVDDRWEEEVKAECWQWRVPMPGEDLWVTYPPRICQALDELALENLDAGRHSLTLDGQLIEEVDFTSMRAIRGTGNYFEVRKAEQPQAQEFEVESRLRSTENSPNTSGRKSRRIVHQAEATPHPLLAEIESLYPNVPKIANISAAAEMKEASPAADPGTVVAARPTENQDDVKWESEGTIPQQPEKKEDVKVDWGSPLKADQFASARKAEDSFSVWYQALRDRGELPHSSDVAADRFSRYASRILPLSVTPPFALAQDMDEDARLESQDHTHVVSGFVASDDFAPMDFSLPPISRRENTKVNTFLVHLKDSGWVSAKDDVRLHLHDGYGKATFHMSLLKLLSVLIVGQKQHSVDAQLLFGRLHPSSDKAEELGIRLYESELLHPLYRKVQGNKLVPKFLVEKRPDGTAQTRALTVVDASSATLLQYVDLNESSGKTYAKARYTFDVFLQAHPKLDTFLRNFLIQSGGIILIRCLISILRRKSLTGELLDVAEDMDITSDDPKIVDRFFGLDQSHISLVVELSPQCAPGGAWEEVQQRSHVIAPSNFIHERSVTAHMYEELFGKRGKSPQGGVFIHTPEPLGGVRPREKIPRPSRNDASSLRELTEAPQTWGVMQSRIPVNRHFAFNMFRSQGAVRSRRPPSPGGPPLDLTAIPRSASVPLPSLSPIRKRNDGILGDAPSTSAMSQAKLPPIDSLHMATPTEACRREALVPSTTLEEAYLQRLHNTSRSRSPTSKHVQRISAKVAEYKNRNFLEDNFRAHTKSPDRLKVETVTKGMLSYKNFDEKNVIPTAASPIGGLRLRPQELK